jgi:hypothetical protein
METLIFEYRFVPLTKQKTKNKTKTNMVVINGVSIDGKQ